MEKLNQMNFEDLCSWIEDNGLPVEVVESFRGRFAYVYYSYCLCFLGIVMKIARCVILCHMLTQYYKLI